MTYNEDLLYPILAHRISTQGEMPRLSEVMSTKVEHRLSRTASKTPPPLVRFVHAKFLSCDIRYNSS